MLFLYRPRETWMPFSVQRNPTGQVAYNQMLQQKFESTRRVAPAVPAVAQRDTIADLRELGALHQSGVLTYAEFEAAKASVLQR